MSIIFYCLFFLSPLIVVPLTSELFEFNKIVLVYLLTGLVLLGWLIKMIMARKIIFRRTILDIPLILFLFSQLISTYTSIDPLTSIFGYYSRFNGGLLSTLCYLLLYWALVSNLQAKQAWAVIHYLLAASCLVCLYGLCQHFGLDKNLWLQDVQNRVFSSLGQPKWLAAYLVALLPLSWALALRKPPLFYCLSLLLFATLLFTKSRSGLLAAGVAYLVFWGLNLKKYRKQFLFLSTSLLLLSLIIGFPWSLRKAAGEPALRSPGEGGTESGDIRQLVWRGAWGVWQRYPLFGSGVETFAYSFYEFRPQEHNLVSEWDFLYNKAHNEYLNYLSTTGLFGLTTYLVVILASIYQLRRQTALLSGYLSILITNFFGFSVVTISLLFFLFPALAAVINENQ